MLNPSDIYVEGGSNDLLVCWTDKVTKYDASSFYNWEQDNLPLHDLEERTHLLWEKFGHPTSALTGMSFIVSADATDSCNPLYFTTLSACLAALPEVINYPILIEVASFGDLGDIVISNKSFGPRGSLQIINRNSAFAGPNGPSFGKNITSVKFDSSYTNYNLASSIVPVGIASSTLVQGSAAPSVTYDLQYAQLFTNGQFISSATNKWTDSRYDTCRPYVFTRKLVNGRRNNRMTAALSSTVVPWDTGASNFYEASSLNFKAYEAVAANVTRDSLNTYDASTINSLTDTEIAWGDSTEWTGQATDLENTVAGFVYLNKLGKIKITNSEGPIYISNFNVDGEHVKDYGIEIRNSSVNLERCAVSRCKKAGLYADNSNVNLLRGFISYRNYGFDTNFNRIGLDYTSKITSYTRQVSYGKGVFLKNSSLNLQDTFDRDGQNGYSSLTYFYPDYYLTNGGEIPSPSMEALYCISRNDIGIHAINSEIIGGRTEQNKQATYGWQDATQLTLELNSEAGVRLDNSVFELDGRSAFYGNYFGLDSFSSKIAVDMLDAKYNQSTAIKLSKSEFTYNKNTYANTTQGGGRTLIDYLGVLGQVSLVENGSDIVSDASKIAPTYVSSMPEVYNAFFTSSCFGYNASSGKVIPSIIAKNNSDLDLVHFHSERTNLQSDYGPVFGAHLACENNSNVTLRGSTKYATYTQGPTTRTANVKVAGMYAKNRSSINLQGPTVLFQAGINVLAEDESLVSITPPQNSNGELLIDEFDLLSEVRNHTMVELHSTRACLVANSKSVINMENCGDFNSLWDDSTLASAVITANTFDYQSTDAFKQATSGGWVQFYPNGYVDNINVVAALNGVGHTDSLTSYSRWNFKDLAPTPVDGVYNWFALQYGQDTSAITTGGMCLRAVGDSLVNVNNVHFPATYPICSSVAYDIEGDPPLDGAKCSRFLIWNIADDSLLRASYLSVSGNHPYDAPYHGPSGTWGVSGAPSSTPDTSSLSILDYFGHNSEHPLGQSEIKNKGVFRLYFSVDPAVNILDDENDSGNRYGLQEQLYSQGYQPSGDLFQYLSATLYDIPVSSYTSLIRNNNGTYEISGFYYASEMMHSPDSIKAVLDYSAAYTFANAQHNSVGKSGLAKVVDIYNPIKATFGDSFDNDTLAGGIASVNNFDFKKDN